MLAFFPAEETWFSEVAETILVILLMLNLSIMVAVHGRRIRGSVRRGRERRARVRIAALLAELDPATRRQSPDWLHAEVRALNELERPLAAEMLLARLDAATSAEARTSLLEAIDASGAVELMLRSLRSWMPWRRSFAAYTLGRCASTQAVPALLERLDDRNRRVRESAARALGRIGDERALPALAELYLGAAPRIGSGIVYDALTALEPARSGEVFVTGLASQQEPVRVAACYGVTSVLDAERARPLLARALDDPAAPVRAAAAQTLGWVGGDELPEHLGRATRDDQRSVRRAAVSALGSFDEPLAVSLAWAALDDPDRDTAVRAGEALVQLSRLRRAGSDARAAIETVKDEQWPVQRALTLAELGAV